MTLTSLTPFSAIACLLFSVPVLTNAPERRILCPQQWATALIVFLLWLGTAAIGLYEIFLTREIFFRIYARFWHNPNAALALGNWGVFLLGLLWIVVFIGGGEAHYRDLGQRRSWQRFGWTLLGELLILALALVV